MSAVAPVVPVTPPPVKPPTGPKIMLLGDSNTGKTSAIRSLVQDCGLEVFVLATEPGIDKLLGDIPSDKLHWNYLPPTPFSADVLETQFHNVNTKSLSDLCRPSPGDKRDSFRQTMDLVSLLRNFKCDRTGQAFGDVYKWGNNRAFVVDSLSGLTDMMLNAWTGIRIGLDKPDYQIVQKCIGNQVTSWCMGLGCWFMLTAHTEREQDDITLQVKIMASTIGKALAPKLPKYFDEIIHTKRDGTKFAWSNITPNYALKARMLPLKDDLACNFKLLNDEWRKRTAVK